MTEGSGNACCGPSHPAHPAHAAPGIAARQPGNGNTGNTDGMALLEGGEFLMGSVAAEAYSDDGEGPVRRVELRPFWLSRTAVSNAEFGAFVAATGYRTTAERHGWSFVFAGLLPDEFPPTRGVAHAPWWRQVYGADWKHPEGPGSAVRERSEHPAVHVSWHDGEAYCEWAGFRLPIEAEWEYAARGGLRGKSFPWGDTLEPDGQHRMNVWQGTFPRHNECADGWYGTCPVDTFAPNGFGMYNMTGNVWEWCRDPLDQSSTMDLPRSLRSARGGSYLCHESYCRRYRVSARQGIAPDSSIGNTGFRCARDA